MHYLESTDAARRTGLVIVFPLGVKGLFNPVVHGLVREVGEQLSDVHVTYALASGSGPSVKDALAAARFAGCDSAVVVAPDDEGTGQSVGNGAAGDWSIDLSPDQMSAASVVHAFQSVMAGLDHAA
jgi:hypothetical protein